MLKGQQRIIAIVAAVAFLIIGVGVLAWLAGATNNPRTERFQTYSEIVEQPAAEDGSPAPEPSEQPLQYRTPCDYPKGQGESDLCAQWRAANAAEDSALWAKWGIIIAAIGSAFLASQIFLTRQALKDASEATKAMHRQNEIAREAQRPWVRVEVQEAAKLIEDSDRLELRADFILQNFGTAPALQVWADGVLSFDKADLVLRDETLAEAEPSAAHGLTTLFPQLPEGTALHVEYEGDIPPTGRLYLLTFCKYRMPGSADWHHTSDIHEVSLADTSGRMFGADGEVLVFKATPNVTTAHNANLKRVLGLSPHMT